eukprot:1139661-Pleurochrysis_carterae.AAC.1
MYKKPVFKRQQPSYSKGAPSAVKGDRVGAAARTLKRVDRTDRDAIDPLVRKHFAEEGRLSAVEADNSHVSAADAACVQCEQQHQHARCLRLVREGTTAIRCLAPAHLRASINDRRNVAVQSPFSAIQHRPAAAGWARPHLAKGERRQSRQQRRTSSEGGGAEPVSQAAGVEKARSQRRDGGVAAVLRPDKVAERVVRETSEMYDMIFGKLPCANAKMGVTLVRPMLAVSSQSTASTLPLTSIHLKRG